MSCLNKNARCSGRDHIITAMPVAKRKRNVLSIEDKLTIINRLEKGETGASLAKIFNVGKATISEIKGRKSEILNFASKLDSTDGSKRRKTMKKASDKKLEEAVYLWFLQKRSQGEPVSGPLLCEKALQFNQKLAGPSEFKASTGWLKSFRSRHGIRELEIQGEALSVGVLAAEVFKESFLKMLEEEGFTKDDIYNADETGLNWKALPSKSVALQYEKAALGFKTSEQRVTIIVCANASGEHVLPLLVIGKSKNPKCFKGATCLPVKYKAQKNACMDSVTFLDWFSHHFIPNVKRHRANEGRTGKVLLLIDNAPSHPSLEELNAVNDNFLVKFLPPNVTALLQPMEQGIIQKLKRTYRKQFLYRLLQQEHDQESIIEFLKNLDEKDCCDMLADAWNMFSSGHLKKAWQKLWGAAEEVYEQDIIEIQDVHEIVTLLQGIPGFSECGQDDAEAWLNSDAADPGYQILSEDEIVALVQDEEHTGINQDDDENNDEQEAESKPTHSEALTAFETALAWCEQQPECTFKEMFLLKRMRDLAAKKIQSSVVKKRKIENKV